MGRKKEKAKERIKLRCPDCGSVKIIFDYSRGEAYCLECGLTFEVPDVAFHTREWREFEGEDFLKRRGGDSITTPIHARQAESKIDKSDITKLPRRIREEFMKISSWEQRLDSAWERNIKYALMEIGRIAEILELPEYVRDEAVKLYKMAAKRKLIRGRSIHSAAAAVLYAACRMYRIPKTLDEMAKAIEDLSKSIKVTKKEIGKVYKFILRELGIKMIPVDPRDFIERIANSLGLSEKVIDKAKEIIDKAEEAGAIFGKGPIGVAAAAVYIASLYCNEKRTQREVANAANVTEVTVRNRYKEIVEALGLEEEIEKLES